MGSNSLFCIGVIVGASLLLWFVYGLHYSGYQAVRLLFLMVAIPLWWAGNRAARYSNEAQALFKSLGKQVPKEFNLVSASLSSHESWARPGLLQDYRRWQRVLAFLGGIATSWMLGTFVVGIGVLQRA
jgi:hypothetical protein